MEVPFFGLTLAFLALTAVPSAYSAVVGAGDQGSKYASVESCGATDRLCLAYPDNCNSHNTCTMMMTARKDSSDPTKYVFEMSAQFTAYVAIALAETNEMGSDSVVECVKESDSVKVYQSVNYQNTTKRGNKRSSPEKQKGVTFVSGSLKDGVINCVFKRDEVTQVAGKDYNLSTGSWFLQVAAGNKVNENNIHHHDEWALTLDKVKLSDSGLMNSYGHRKSTASTSSATALSFLSALFVAFYVF